MRKTLCLTALAFALALTACAPSAQFVNAVDRSASVILPEYEAYVAADPALDATTKRIRLRTASSLRKLIDAAKQSDQ